jgi:hypothetical protein
VKGKPPFPYPQLTPGQVRFLDELANQLRELEEQLPRDLAKRLRMFRLPSDHPLLQWARAYEQQQRRESGQEIEREIKQAREQYKPAKRAAKRGRPKVVFPHLGDAIEELERARSNRPVLNAPKKAADFVMKYLRDHGDDVADEQERTIKRRIKNVGQKSPR